MREPHTSGNQKQSHQRIATRSMAFLLCLGAIAGVLIWAKLRLVTDIPRSAYADPRENEVLPDSHSEGEASELTQMVDDSGPQGERP